MADMVLSVRWVRRPKHRYRCCECERSIREDLYRFYGAAEVDEKPQTFYYHVGCVRTEWADKYPQFAEAVAYRKRYLDKEAAKTTPTPKQVLAEEKSL